MELGEGRGGDDLELGEGRGSDGVVGEREVLERRRLAQQGRQAAHTQRPQLRPTKRKKKKCIGE